MRCAGSDESTVKFSVSPRPRDHDRLLDLKKRREKSPNSSMCAHEPICEWVQGQRPKAPALRCPPRRALPPAAADTKQEGPRYWTVVAAVGSGFSTLGLSQRPFVTQGRQSCGWLAALCLHVSGDGDLITFKASRQGLLARGPRRSWSHVFPEGGLPKSGKKGTWGRGTVMVLTTLLR